MTKFKKYLAVFAATVLLVSAFAPGLILSAAYTGSQAVTILEYADGSGYALAATATAWSEDEQVWALAKIYYGNSLYDSDYEQATPLSGPCTALASAYSAIVEERSQLDGYSGFSDYGNF